MEVCADNNQSVINATEGGAIRIELCSALSEGGLTPTRGFLKVAKKITTLPVYVMIRSRAGDDFEYDNNDMETMVDDLKLLKENGADGFVFGALTSSKEIDAEACKMILDNAAPLPVTFHRAFDYVSDPFQALEVLIELGFKRVLTSGQATTAEKGVEMIKQLVTAANDRITIIPGCGINEFNLCKILKETKVIEFHSSAKRNINILSVPEDKRPKDPTNTTDISADLNTSTDVEVVQRMVKIYKQIKG